MSFLYAAYKTVRNRGREFNYLDSLAHIWVYMQHMAATPRRPLPQGYGMPGPFGILQELQPQILPAHHLDLALREILIHAQMRAPGTRSLGRWNDLATFINTVKAHGESAARSDDERAIYDTLHRLVHQQLPWQTTVLKRDMVRMWMMMQSPEVRRRVEATLGMTVDQYYFMAFANIAKADKDWRWSRFCHYREYGIEDAAAAGFYARLSDSPEGHRAAQQQAQVHDAEWEYSWNPLQARPIIHLPTPSGLDYACPAPLHLHRRLFSGVFYDLVNTAGFPEALGDAYDALTGLTLRRGCPALNATKPAPYPGPRGVQHHGADWWGCDGTANVFVECKTKRMAAAARVLRDPAILEREIGTMARAVVQNYRNIQEALDGRAGWTRNELPIYSIITTLEDWILFSPTSRRMLDAAIEQQMRAHGLDLGLLARAPYTICCAYELEELVFAWADHGVQAVMTAKHDGQRDRWMIGPFLQDTYATADTRQRAHDLFTPESETLHATIMDIARLGAGKR